MKNLMQLIKNVYTVCVVNSSGNKRVIRLEEESDAEHKLVSDSRLRQIVADDQFQFDADPQIREMLRQRVRNSGLQAAPAKNSLLEIFLPLFSSRHIEIKMAVISLALFVMVGLGPKSNQGSDRKLHLFFLADTLGDSSSFQNPAVQDTAFRVQY